jgi:type IV secretory pathway component VirB8
LEKERKEKEKLERMNNEERSKYEQKLHKKALKKQNAIKAKVILLGYNSVICFCVVIFMRLTPFLKVLKG